MLKMPQLIASLPTYVPGKPIEAVAREFNLNPTDIAKLASNENPLGAPKAAQEAAARTLTGLHIYPDGASVNLRDKIAAKFGVERDWVVVGNGSAEIIEMVAKGYLDTDETTMFSQYGFAMYKVATLASNHAFQEIPAAPGYRHDLNRFLMEITSKTKVIYIANPNNPTGTRISKEELDRFVNEVPEHVLIVIDEAYQEYVESSDFPDSLDYVRKQDKRNVLVLRTFSKIYGLAALRLGYGFGHPTLLRGIEKVRSPFNINLMAQVAGVAALDCADHVAASKKLVKEGKAQILDRLKPLGLKIFGDEGNFLMIDTGHDAIRVFTELQRRGVIVRPLSGYDLPTCIRVTFGTAAENEKFCKALKEILS
jgi:histidinol-phosphate aminotransferase